MHGQACIETAVIPGQSRGEQREVGVLCGILWHYWGKGS